MLDINLAILSDFFFFANICIVICESNIINILLLISIFSSSNTEGSTSECVPPPLPRVVDKMKMRGVQTGEGGRLHRMKEGREFKSEKEIKGVLMIG